MVELVCWFVVNFGCLVCFVYFTNKQNYLFALNVWILQ